MLYNINRAEGAEPKNEDQLMQDRLDEIIEQIQGFEANIPGFEKMSTDEQRETVKKMIMRDMGIY